MSPLVDAVARCLAKHRHSGMFIPADQWAGEIGDAYRKEAQCVLDTIARYNDGQCSGGLPPAVRQ
jgi:hypothetical protein